MPPKKNGAPKEAKAKADVTGSTQTVPEQADTKQEPQSPGKPNASSVKPVSSGSPRKSSTCTTGTLAAPAVLGQSSGARQGRGNQRGCKGEPELTEEGLLSISPESLQMLTRVPPST